MHHIRLHRFRTLQTVKPRRINPIRGNARLIRRTSQFDLKLSRVRVKACHQIRPVIGKLRHFLELLNPDIFIDAGHPVRTDQFFLALPGVDSMLRDQKPAAKPALCHAAQHARISRRHTVIHIRPRQPHAKCQKQRKIHGAHRPEEIRKHRPRIPHRITFLHRPEKILPHEKFIQREFLLPEKGEQGIPVYILVHQQAPQCGVLPLI